MVFITTLPIFASYKGNICNSILVFINYLIEMLYNKLIKVTINTLKLAQLIPNIVV